MEFIFAFYLLSGAFKGILPLFGLSFLPDLTAISAVALTIILLIDRNKNMKYENLYYLIMIFIFYILIIVSLNYTTSNNYGYVKTLYFSTSILAFIFPIFININIQKFMRYFTGMTFTITFLFFNFYIHYISGDLSIDLPKEKILQLTALYLTLSILLSIIFLYYVFEKQEKKYISYLIIIISLIMMIFTGGRGPLLFSILIVFISWMKKIFLFILNLKIKKNTLILLISSILVILFLINLSSNFIKDNQLSILFEHSFNRFYTLFESKGGGESAHQRIIYWNFSFDKIDKSPILGYGIGSFGYEYTGIDQRDYPHNIFIETWFEIGLIPLLMLISFFIVILFKIAINKCNYCMVLYFLLILNLMKSSSLIDTRIMFGFFGFFISIDSYRKYQKELKDGKRI
jgi:O-antigen ligase